MRFYLKLAFERIRFLRILSVLVLLLNSCSNTCNDDGTESTRVIDFKDVRYRNFSPFAGNEKLRFLRNGLDTVFFTGQGINSHYEEEFGPGHDCQIRYRLLNREVVFKNTFSKLSMEYFVGGTTENLSEFYAFKINSATFGSYSMEKGFNERMALAVLDTVYLSVVPFGSLSGDSIYYNLYTPAKSLEKFLRLKIGSDIYEVVR